jgi:hypothetical protein
MAGMSAFLLGLTVAPECALIAIGLVLPKRWIQTETQPGTKLSHYQAPPEFRRCLCDMHYGLRCER